MTHTLHRQGSPEELEKDFVVFSMAAKTVNWSGAGEKLKKVFQILEGNGPVNFGDIKTGGLFYADRESIRANVQDGSYIHFVYDSMEAVERILAELNQADIGMSVVVSGLVDVVDRSCRQAGLAMHTVEYSGGVHGRTDLLPERPVLQVTTMCGHGLVATNLVAEMVRQVRTGRKSAAQAAVELARPCQCGVFNVKRAEALLLKLAK